MDHGVLKDFNYYAALMKLRKFNLDFLLGLSIDI